MWKIYKLPLIITLKTSYTGGYQLPATTQEALGICVLYVEGTKDLVLLAIIIKLESICLFSR